LTGPGPCNALILQAEDGTADTVRPRLHGLGADLDRVFVWRGKGADGPPRIPSGLDLLDRALEHSAARLLIIDPVTSYFDPSIFMASDQAVRRALDPLGALAESRRCHVLMHRRLSKRGGTEAIYRGLGSVGLGAVCRSVWLIARDPHRAGRRVLTQVKNNLAPPQSRLALDVKSNSDALPTLEWLGTSPLSAADLLSGRHAARSAARPPIS
jgi:hypothetical protein